MMTTNIPSQKSFISRYLPILDWLPKYERAWLRSDFLAGITIMALLVPEGMAYAELAGMPPQTAFYAAPIGLLLFAIFGTSRQLVVAVSSAIAVMSASIVGKLAVSDTPEYIALTAGLALLAGLVAILAGVLRLGRIAQFFSDSVLAGFISGLALVISIKQLPKMFGFEGGHGNFWERLYDFLIHLNETHWLTLAVAITSLLLMVIIERRFHKIPAALVTMIYGIVVVSVFSLEAQGVHVIGDIPAGLTRPQMPAVTWSDLMLLLPGAIGLTLVMFAEAVGPARSFAGKHGDEISADQELVGLGFANAGAGLFQGFPIGASLSKSAANDAAGAHSQMSGIFAAGLTALVALFLTPLFHNLSEATLGAIVIVAVAGMVKVEKFKHLYRVRKLDFTLGLVALLGVLTFEETLVGLLVAVVVSLLALVARASQPRLSVLGRRPGRIVYGDLTQHPQYETVPGLLVVRPDEGIFFANADTLRDEIRTLINDSEPPILAVLLDLEMTVDLDVPGAEMLAELKKDLSQANVTLMLTRVRSETRLILDRSGVTAVIGQENFHPEIIAGVLTFEKEHGYSDRLVLAADVLNSLSDSLGAAAAQTKGLEQEALTRYQEQITAIARQITTEDKQL
jgi:sulfate permease, SulP family